MLPFQNQHQNILILESIKYPLTSIDGYSFIHCTQFTPYSWRLRRAWPTAARFCKTATSVHSSMSSLKTRILSGARTEDHIKHQINQTPPLDIRRICAERASWQGWVKPWYRMFFFFLPHFFFSFSSNHNLLTN